MTDHISNQGNALSGSCKVFSKMIGAKGKDVLYVDDHVLSGIVKPMDHG